MDLRISISEEEFTKLSGFAFGQKLIQPAIQQSRGQRPEIKKMVYENLTPGQKSLFGFWVLYGHVGEGWLSFFRESLYGDGYAKYLPMIKAGLQRVGSQALLENILWAETLFAQYQESLSASSDASASKEVEQAFTQASETLFTLLPETMHEIEVYARAHPEEFMA